MSGGGGSLQNFPIKLYFPQRENPPAAFDGCPPFAKGGFRKTANYLNAKVV
jgi:hypothetical protein